MDAAAGMTDEMLAALEKKIHSEYNKAYKDAQKKLNDYLAKFKVKDAIKLAQVAAGEITDAEYNQWRLGQIMISKRWAEMRDTLAEDLVHTDQIAMSMVNDYLPEVYALNHNYGTFEIEKSSMMNTSYTLYDRQTVERLIRDNPQLLPAPKVDIPKDLLWNKQHIQSAITQGILTGESIPKIAKRLRNVTDMDRYAAIRNARTMTTSAQNGGRIDSYKRAARLGIKGKKQWMSARDMRTRSEHRHADGQRVDVDKPFKIDGYKLDFPGDASLGAPGYLIYNCRCTVVFEEEGFEDDALSDILSQNNKLGDMSYEDWLEATPVSKHYDETVKEYQERIKGMTLTKTQSQIVNQTVQDLTIPQVDSAAGALLTQAGVAYNPVTQLGKAESAYDSIKALAGGDMTQGSCASLALAYAARRNGVDVQDFRGGASRAWFASKANKWDLAKECGIDRSKSSRNSSDTAWDRIKKAGLEQDKEYLVGYAGHMAVVRYTGSGYEYLELQSPFQNGWKKLNAGILRSRFGACDSGRYSPIQIYSVESCNSDTFKSLMGYINTPIGKQKKGHTGSIK